MQVNAWTDARQGGNTAAVPGHDEEADPLMGPALRTWLRDNDVSQTQLARDLRISRGTVKNWVAGHGMSTGNRERLADYMERHRANPTGDAPTSSTERASTHEPNIPNQATGGAATGGVSVASDSGVDEPFVMDRPHGVTDDEWAAFRAGAALKGGELEDFASWLNGVVSRGRRAVEAAQSLE